MLTFSTVPSGELSSSSLSELSVSQAWLSLVASKGTLSVLFSSWPWPGSTLDEPLPSDILSDHSLKEAVD